MKRIAFLFLLACLSLLKAEAYEWTDEKGVTWSFNQWSYSFNNVNQYYWTIGGASNYQDDVTIPDMVFITTDAGLEAHNVEAINLSLDASSVTVPSGIKYVNCWLDKGSGVVKLSASNPPIFGGAGESIVFKVPDESLDTYRKAEGWKDIADRIIGQNAKTDYTVSTTAKAESSGLHEVIGENNLSNVMSLKISGSINSYDIMIIRNKMRNIQHLDLSDTKIVANSFQYYTGYSTEDNVLGSYAFSGLNTLRTVILPKAITRIGPNAFQYCNGLEKVVCQTGIKTIGSYAFNGCYRLKEVTLREGIETIGDWAFSSCSNLNEIKLPEGIKTIGSAAFSSCNNLEKVELPSTLEEIYGGYSYSYYGAFSGCSKLTSIKLPDRLRLIGNGAFNGTSLKEIHIPSSVTSIGENAFSTNTLSDVYIYTVEPIQIAQNTFSTWTTATLHVPSFSYNRYYWNTQWSQFSKIIENEGTFPYNYFYANNDLHFDDNTGIMEGTPDADLNGGAGLIVETTKSKLHLGKVTMSETGSIIADDNLTVDELTLNMNINGFQWYFISLPYRVKVSNITAPGQYVIRYYDGYERATRGGGGWKDFTGTYLQPKQGYIIQCDNYGMLSMVVEKADMDFSGGTRQDALSSYASTNAQNASWNFLGNPHSSYFDIDDTGYDAPITVWNGYSYQAVRVGDDQYHLAPMQGFFVQKPEGKSEISFPASGRHTLNQWSERVAKKEAAGSRGSEGSEREIVNLTIGSNESIADQTRIVFNQQKSADYEIDCDAAKFMSNQAEAQLYSLGYDGTQYAINERQQGDVNLGYTAKNQGELTISSPRMDRQVWLYDKVLNVTHDLSIGGYTFNTEAGTYEGRFTIKSGNSATAIENVSRQDQNEPTTNYTLNGIRTDDNHRGIVIEKSTSKTTKIIRK